MKHLINLDLTKAQIKILEPLLDELKQEWGGVSKKGAIILQPQTEGAKFTGKLYGQVMPSRFSQIILDVIKAYNEEGAE